MDEDVVMDENKLEDFEKEDQAKEAVAEEHFEPEAKVLDEEKDKGSKDQDQSEGIYYYNRQELKERNNEEDKTKRSSGIYYNRDGSLKDLPPIDRKESFGGQKIAIAIGVAVLVGVIAAATMHGATTLVRVLNKENQAVSRIEEKQPIKEKEASIAPTEEVKGESQSETNPLGGVEEVAKTAMPAVVAITNKSVQEVQSWFGGQTEEYESQTSGSGIIVGENDTELLIATNYHVVEGASTLTVAFADDEAVEGLVKGADASHDLAVLAVKLEDISESTKKEIRVIEIGNSDSLNVGQQVVAIGNALGYGQSVTTGIVSALNRQVTVDDNTNSLIQTDAAINPGNSGGALLNMKGQLIGINAVKYAASEVEGMGYAIPVAIAQPILDDLMNRQTRYQVAKENASYLGVSCKNVSEETSQAYGIPMGVYVAEVTDKGPAAAAGIKKGDIIMELDGIKVSDYETLVNSLKYYAAGEKVEIVVSRANDGNYREQKIEVTLGNKEDMPQASNPGEESLQEQNPKNGQRKESPRGGFFQGPSINDLLP